MHQIRSIFCVISVLVPVAAANADEPTLWFVAKTIDGNVGKVCYAVTTADVDNDGKRDIVAVTENRVLWYQNPSWKMHVIIEDQTPLDNVCIAPLDIDGDGNIDFALGAGWTKTGTLHWLTRGSSLDEKWTVHSIGEEKWTHRMRFADVLSTGKPQLVVSPLNATVGDGVRLTAFEIPADPRKDRWPSTVLNAELNRMHNHWHIDFDGNAVLDTLTSSREGVNMVRRTVGGWQRTRLGAGVTAGELNQNGAGEIKVGTLATGRRFITTVEPMHGHSVAVYTAPAKDSADGLWVRHVIDTGFKRGHALWTADIDGDGSDEIAFGHSDTPDTFGVIVYNCTSEDGSVWAKYVVDTGGMATEDLIVEDLTGDGKPDIVAGGRATHNVKLYVQQP
ncbi:MAG: VCBS repeat-containing protein [Fuerstiella sp.]